MVITDGQMEKKGTVRFRVAYMGFLGFFLVYAMRINISVALVDMVEQDVKNDSMNDNCPVDEDNTTSYHSGTLENFLYCVFFQKNH